MQEEPALPVFKRVVGQWRHGRLTLGEAGQAIIEAIDTSNIQAGMALLSPELLEEVKRQVDGLPHSSEGWEHLERWYIGGAFPADGRRIQRDPFAVPPEERARLRGQAELLRRYFATTR